MMNICEAIEYMTSGSDKVVQVFNSDKRSYLAYDSQKGVHWRVKCTNEFDGPFIYSEFSLGIKFEIYEAQKEITHSDALARLLNGETLEDLYGATYRLIDRKIMCRFPNHDEFMESSMSLTNFISRAWRIEGE